MRRLFLLAVVLTGLPCLAQTNRPQTRPASSQPTPESLQRQIAQLNQIIAGLQDRVNSLAGQVKMLQQAMGPPAGQPPASTQSAQKIEKGMSLDEVKRIAGDPSEMTVSATGITICRWYEFTDVPIADPPGRYRGTAGDSRLQDLSHGETPRPLTRRVTTRTLVVLLRDNKVIEVQDTTIAPRN